MPQPDPGDRRRGHHESDLDRLERKVDFLIVTQHQDRRMLREILGRVKQIQDQDGEAVTFELTAATPTENNQ